jgi:hypothetical protein
VLHHVCRIHHVGTDETFRDVRMNFAGCNLSSRTTTYRPCSLRVKKKKEKEAVVVSWRKNKYEKKKFALSLSYLASSGPTV